ncbi:hypothetical protein LCGC14_0840660 [marine sediment metagenome]|uniref:Uncharacterized protein n=1 Tax=marine sediment metagenome TaxID=412755 RepID=A0A0F9SKM5_9ZZZZ
MKCPNCTQPFIEERPPKFLCSTCGWLEKIDKEWKSCDAPESPPPGESPPPQESASEPEPKTTAQIHSVQNVPQPELNPAALEPDPAAHEPDPAAHEPGPNCSVKKYLGGLLTVTEVDE